MAKNDYGIQVNKKNRIAELKSQLSLFILCLPGVVATFIWGYMPLSGLVLAFKDYKPRDGIWGSDWVDPIFKNFEILFVTGNMGRIIGNTVGYSIATIIIQIVVPVIFALLLFEVRQRWAVKLIQTFAIFPRFLSWVVVGFITYALLDINKGLINVMLGGFGIEAVAWYQFPEAWIFIIPIVSLWKVLGINSVMYYAALMGVDAQLFEAAELDGATKLQKIWHISIPCINNIIIILLILSLGSVFRGDFGLFYQIPRNSAAILSTTDVIDTYIYRAIAGTSGSSLEMSTAVALIQSIVGFICIVSANLIVKKIDNEKGLF